MSDALLVYLAKLHFPFRGSGEKVYRLESLTLHSGVDLLVQIGVALEALRGLKSGISSIQSVLVLVNLLE